MKRRIRWALGVVLILSVTLCMMCGSAFADDSIVIESGTCGDNLTWTLDDAGTLTISGIGDMTESPWPHNLIRKIIIEPGVSTIQDAAFDCSSELTSISFPESIQTIGRGAFRRCDSLTSVTIPASVREIGVGAFASCNHMLDINVDVGNQYYSSEDGVLLSMERTQDGVWMDFGKKDLVQYPAGKEIESYAIPDNIVKIGSEAFAGCNYLIEVTIPKSVTSIGDGAFASCERLSNITIPYGVTVIGAHAFESCYSLSSITIPASVKSIGYYAFSRCGLNSIYFQSDAPSMGDSLFVGVTATAFYPAGNSTWTDDVMQTYYEDDGEIIWVPMETDPVVDSGTCGDNLTWTFDTSGTLTISGTGDMTNYYKDVVQSNTVNSDRPPWATYLDRGLIKKAVITPGVTSIGDGAFNAYSTSFIVNEYDISGASSLTDIDIPNSVTSIGSGAFRACCGLTSISIPDSVTSIGEYALYKCKRLTSISISDSVKTIARGTFSQCISLTNISVPNSVTTIGPEAFMYCFSLSSISTPDGVTSIGVDAFFHCDSLDAIALPKYLDYIGSGAFSYCDSLTTVTIPASVREIGAGAFRSCTHLMDIYVDQDNLYYSSEDGVLLSLERTQDGIWMDSEKRELIQYPAGKEKESFAIPDHVVKIGSSAFQQCIYLTEITIPDGVNAIEHNAFDCCYNLSSITIPTSVKSIGSSAFNFCDLNNIYYLGDAPSMGDYLFQGNTTTAFYPAGNSTWTSDVMQDYGGTITWTPWEVPISTTKVSSVSLTLEGQIGVNFYLQIPIDLIDSGNQVCFTCNDLETLIPITSDHKTTLIQQTVYRFSYEVAAKEMNDTISLRVIDGNGEALSLVNAKDADVTDGYQYSVAKYCNLVDTYGDDRIKSLTSAMMNYGGYAQDYFKYGTGAGKVDGLRADMDAVTLETLTPYRSTRSDSKVNGISYYATSLILTSETTIRHYFKLDQGAVIEDYTFTCGDAVLTPVAKNGQYYVDIPNIAAKDLDTAYTLTVTKANESYVITYYALTYAYSVLKNSQETTLLDMVKALYLYNQAANTYFGES